jgi:RNA polymerase sigma-70 factor, ECF subfamily
MTTGFTDASDREAMERLVRGHDAALSELMERHAEPLFHFLLRSLGNEEDSNDLAQETFVRIYRNSARFDPGQKFTTWMYAIASNLIRDRFRWRSRHPATSLENENCETTGGLQATLPAPGAAPDEDLQAGECAEAVRKAVGSLPEDLREPLVLAVYQELPQAEIAEILKCSAKAVETRIYRARKLLRAALGEWLRG